MSILRRAARSFLYASGSSWLRIVTCSASLSSMQYARGKKSAELIKARDTRQAWLQFQRNDSFLPLRYSCRSTRLIYDAYITCSR